MPQGWAVGERGWGVAGVRAGGWRGGSGWRGVWGQRCGCTCCSGLGSLDQSLNRGQPGDGCGWAGHRRCEGPHLCDSAWCPDDLFACMSVL